MKHIFTSLVLLTFIFGKTNAQTWCPPGAVWNYTVYSPIPPVDGYQELRYQDTVTIDGKLCQQLDLVTNEISVSWGNTWRTTYRTIYTNLQNQLLTYRSASNRFDTIAMFNARPGAHWYAYGYQGTSNPAINIPQYTVHDTGHAVINGVNLKYLTVGIGDSVTVFTPTNSIYLHRIYERIGNARLFLHLSSVPNLVDAVARDGSFTCYWDNTFPGYSLPGMRCNYNPVSIKEASAERGTQFFPNPSNGLFTVHADYEGPFFVYSSTGDLVKTVHWTSSSTILDLGDLPNGMYLVKSSESREMPVQKLLKQ